MDVDNKGNYPVKYIKSETFENIKMFFFFYIA